jgi:hypothetical protein
MAITFSGVDHFFAAALHDIVTGGRAVASHNAEIQQDGVKVEEVTAAVGAFYPPALVALEIERVSMFAIGVVCQLIMQHGSAAKASAANPSLPLTLFTQAEQLLEQNPQLIQQAAALFQV